MGKKLNDGDETQLNEKIVIPAPTKEMIDKLPKEMQDLYKHKAKYEINEDGSVTFYPTPNCKPSTTQMNASKVSMDYVLNQQNCTKAAVFSDPEKEIIQKNDSRCSFITSSVTAW